MGRLIALPQRSGGIARSSTRHAARTQADGRTFRPRRAHLLPVAVGGRGALALLFGLLILTRHDITVSRLALVFGSYVLLGGIALISTLTEETVPEALRWGHLLTGFASLLAGLMTLLWTHINGFTLAILAATWAVLTGLVELTASTTSLLETPVAGQRRRVRTGMGMLAIAGIPAMAVGLVLLTRPDVGVGALATVLGIYAVIAGAALLAAAWHLLDDHSAPR